MSAFASLPAFVSPVIILASVRTERNASTTRSTCYGDELFPPPRTDPSQFPRLKPVTHIYHTVRSSTGGKSLLVIPHRSHVLSIDRIPKQSRRRERCQRNARHSHRKRWATAAKDRLSLNRDSRLCKVQDGQCFSHMRRSWILTTLPLSTTIISAFLSQWRILPLHR